MPPEQADRLHTVAWEAGAIYSVTPGKFAFTFHADEAATRRAIDEHPDKFFCSTFEHTKYVPYCSDFGPVDLDRTVTFCRKIRAVLCDPRISGREVVFYAEALNSEFRTNAAYLLGAYLVLHEGWSPEKAAAPFERIVPSPWAHFRDATDAPSDFELPIRDCLAGLNRAAHEGWLNIDSFDRAIYREQTRDGYTTVCPRFIAFQGPVAARARARPTWAHPPAHFLAAFQRSARRGTDVTAVVRLNEASLYDPREFSDAGIALYDLEFEDCTVPSAAVVKATPKP
ncbi:dual specificity protein phosphatase [Baffinella frigidus]|nr:dual specificity protein phosphatase [Cryptophyta sp. CCMP2293]